MSDTRLYTVVEARAQLSSLIRKASGGERITLSVNGIPGAVLVGVAEWAGIEQRLRGDAEAVETQHLQA